jgi:N-succinyldiaminopimelate aminotransferase
MNPDIDRLQAYPFERLARLLDGVAPGGDGVPVSLAIGEPQHAPPSFIADAVIAHLHQLSRYPTTRGGAPLREAIARWLYRRFGLPAASIDPERHVLPVNGTREALFAIAQAVVDRGSDPLVLMPNPFYQIYEGAALLSGAEPGYINNKDNGLPDFSLVSDEQWRRCRLLYICTPGNPSGAVMHLAALQELITLADRHDFIIASDECYSELYPDEAAPPPGLLQAAAASGNDVYERCIVFHSLSKRSSAPGLRSGFVAGDAEILAHFLRYRTYHGCSMPLPTQSASVAAWNDEDHVRKNRARYREKFDAVLDLLNGALDVERPAGGFYLWPRTPGKYQDDDEAFTRDLYQKEGVTVLPGSYLSRGSLGTNPGTGRVRIALVAPLDECIDAATRIRRFVEPC